MSDSEDHAAGMPLVEPISPSTSPEPQGGAKRKRDEVPAESKRAAKRRKSKKPKDIADDALDLEAGVNHAIAHMDSQLLADHVAQRTKRFQGDLSLVELDDIRVPASSIVDTSAWSEPRNLESLPAFLENFAGSRSARGKRSKNKLSNAHGEKGRPHTLVVAGAGLRAADLTRALRGFQTKESMVAKLFAKHIKLKEAMDMAKKTRMGIGVGTPQRIADLLESGALSSTGLERILIDASHIDQKKRGILDMKETQAPLVSLLSRSELKDRYAADDNKLELIFY